MKSLLPVIVAVLVLVSGIVSCAPSTPPTSTPVPATTPLPAAISVTNLSIEPAQIQVGEAATITIVLSNTGGTSGNYLLVLKINSVKYAEKSIIVTGSNIEITSYSATINEAGSYTVTAGDLNTSFTVIALKDETFSPLVRQDDYSQQQLGELKRQQAELEMKLWLQQQELDRLKREQNWLEWEQKQKEILEQAERIAQLEFELWLTQTENQLYGDTDWIERWNRIYEE